MALAVVTVVSGGLAVVDVTATKPGNGKAVSEAANGRGVAVTKVTPAIGGLAGLPVTYITTGP
jgi:hypothetical protein